MSEENQTPNIFSLQEHFCLFIYQKKTGNELRTIRGPVKDMRIQFVEKSNSTIITYDSPDPLWPEDEKENHHHEIVIKDTTRDEHDAFCAEYAAHLYRKEFVGKL
jgi:hypothetical protein